MTNKKPSETQDKSINDLVNSCLSFVDKNGKIISKSSTGVNSSLEMKYEREDLTFHFRVYSHGQGNGSCYLQVKQNEEVVFEATGGFTAKANNMKAKVYQTGDWEKTVPAWKK